MRILLIKPTIGRPDQGRYVDEGRMEPLQLGLLAGLTPPGHEVVLADDRFETIPYDGGWDLAALTVESFTARRAYEIATALHRRGIPVVMGGMHVTLLPEEALDYADAIITGDAETVWAEMLADLAAGRLKRRYDAAANPQPQLGVAVDRAVFAGKPYLPITLLQFSRGCPHACTYCAISCYFHRHHYTRPIAEVVAEIRAQRRRLLFFVDDNITANRRALKELCRALIPLRVRWVSQGSMDMLDDPELMELIVASGCLGFVIGFESLTASSLAEMRKSPNRRPYDEVVEHLRRLGLQTWAAFTIGHDGDDLASIRRTCDWAIRQKFTFAAFNILMPYPGTELYHRLEAEGRLLYDGRWWLHPDYRFNHAAFVPAQMTADELTAIGFECRSRFSAPGAIWSRFLEPRTNLRSPYRALTYWLYNPLFRREVFRKQGLHFGIEDRDLEPFGSKETP
ncbi:MAG: radical SAM protein [Bacillota bacterium]|nr:radical SAM protein [Bacillota bacterium]